MLPQTLSVTFTPGTTPGTKVVANVLSLEAHPITFGLPKKTNADQCWTRADVFLFVCAFCVKRGFNKS